MNLSIGVKGVTFVKNHEMLHRYKNRTSIFDVETRTAISSDVFDDQGERRGVSSDVFDDQGERRGVSSGVFDVEARTAVSSGVFDVEARTTISSDVFDDQGERCGGMIFLPAACQVEGRMNKQMDRRHIINMVIVR